MSDLWAVGTKHRIGIQNYEILGYRKSRTLVLLKCDGKILSMTVGEYRRILADVSSTTKMDTSPDYTI